MALTAAAAWIAVPAHGATSVFTDASAFQAAISGLSSGALDFESIAPDTLLSTAGLTQTVGATGVGIVFPPSVSDVLGGPALDLKVTGFTETGYNTLGTADPEDFDQFVGGTILSVGFTQPVLAFGLTVVSANTPGGTLFDGDIELRAAGTNVALAVSDRASLGFAMLVGGGTQEVSAYFLGVTSDAPFTTAILEAGAGTPDGSLFFWADDLAIAVPEPDPRTLLLAGALFLSLLWRRAR